ncbi:MAG: hypothetical protein ABL993_05320 [Vicinamibacterales bacterium]
MLRDTVRPAPGEGLELVAVRVVETDWITGLEVTLRVGPTGSDDFIGRLLVPYSGFSFLIEADCRGRTPIGYREIEPSATRLRKLMRTIEADVRVVPELQRSVRCPLPAGEFIPQPREIVRGLNDGNTLDGLRSLVGTEIKTFYTPSVDLFVGGGISVPNCSIPVGTRFLVLSARSSVVNDRDDTAAMLLASLQDTSVDRSISSISLALESAPVEAIQVYQEHGLYWHGDAEFLRDCAFIIRRADGVEAAFRAYQDAGDLRLSTGVEAIAGLRARYSLRWDSRWIE